MDDALEIKNTKQARLVGVLVLMSISLLQLATEFLGTHDKGRLLSKAITMLIGLPLLVVWANAVTSWVQRRRVGASGPLVLGAIAAGLLFAVLLRTTQLVSLSIQVLRAHDQDWTVGGNVFRVGFAMGLTSFAIWAVAFVLPLAMEDARVRALEAEKLRTQAELARLRANLDPHFLLNTLNAIAGLVTEDPVKACRLIGTLGDLMRDSVTSEGEMQTLDEQVAWLRRYAQILEARHVGQVAFHWDIGAGTREATLPRLLLQPLVENAVKHGALRRAGGGEITLRTEASRDGKLVCTVDDNGPGVPPGNTRPGAFGLLSVRRRLALRYGESASVRLESSSAGTRTTVEMPLEQGIRA